MVRGSWRLVARRSPDIGPVPEGAISDGTARRGQPERGAARGNAHGAAHVRRGTTGAPDVILHDHRPLPRALQQAPIMHIMSTSRATSRPCPSPRSHPPSSPLVPHHTDAPLFGAARAECFPEEEADVRSGRAEGDAALGPASDGESGLGRPAASC